MKVESIYALVMSGYPVYIEGGSGIGKTEFMDFIAREVAHPDLVVNWNAGGLDDKELFGMTFVSPQLVDENGNPIEVPFTNYALTRAAMTLQGLNEGRITPPPERINKRRQVLIVVDELANASNAVKSSIQAAITSGGKWAGFDIGTPLVIAAGNPPDISSLASPLGPGLSTRMIRVRWEFTPADFTRFLYLVLLRQQVEEIRRERYAQEGQAENYHPLSDKEYVEYLESVYDSLEQKSTLLRQAIEYAKAAIKAGRPLEWSIGQLPDPKLVQHYHQRFITLLYPYFAEGSYDEDLQTIDLAEAAESDRPFPTNRTMTWAIGAAAVLSALHGTPSHPDVYEAIAGLVGKNIAERVYQIIGNAMIPSVEELTAWLDGTVPIDEDRVRQILKNPDLLNSFTNLLVEVSRQVFAKVFETSGLPENMTQRLKPLYLSKELGRGSIDIVLPLLYLIHPYRSLFGAGETTFTVLDNLGKIASIIIKEHPVFNYRLSRAIPFDISDQLFRAMMFIINNAEDIVWLESIGKLREEMGWLLFFESIRIRQSNRALSYLKESSKAVDTNTILDLKDNVGYVDSFAIGFYNFLPVAIKHFDTFAKLLRIDSASAPKVEKAIQVLQDLLSRNYIGVSYRFIGGIVPFMSEAQETINKAYGTAFVDTVNLLERMRSKSLIAHDVVMDIYMPLVEHAEKRQEFLAADKTIKKTISQNLADNIRLKLSVVSAEELHVEDRDNFVSRMQENVKTLLQAIKPLLPLPMHKLIPREQSDNGFAYGILYFDNEFVAQLNSLRIWMPQPKKQRQGDVRIELSQLNTDTLSKLTSLEERLGLAALLVQHGINVMLIGEFGVGKTDWARYLVELSMEQLGPEERNLLKSRNLRPVVFVPGPSLDSPELGGISYPFYNVAEKNLKVLPAMPHFFRDLYEIGEINDRVLKIVILDEITGMRPQTLRALAAAMPNRPGGRKIKGPVVWVATGNPPEGSDLFLNPKRIVPSNLATPLPEVIRRRFVVIPIGASRIDQRKMEVGKTLAKFLAANLNAEFLSGKGFNYNTSWNMPKLPPRDRIAVHTAYWAQVIAEYTILNPQNLLNATGIQDSELLPFDSPATRDKLVRALGVISAADAPFNSTENIAFVARAVVGKEIADRIIEFWMGTKNKFPDVEELESALNRPTLNELAQYQREEFLNKAHDFQNINRHRGSGGEHALKFPETFENNEKANLLRGGRYA